MSMTIAPPRPPRLSPCQRAVLRVALNILALLLVYSFAAIAVAATPAVAVGEMAACT